MSVAGTSQRKIDEPRIVLFETILVNSQPTSWGRRCVWPLVSALIQLVGITLILFGSALFPQRESLTPPERITRIFAPAPQKKQETKVVTPGQSSEPPQAVVGIDVTPDDSSHLKIAFRPDPSGEQLRSVIQKLGAALAFASPDQVSDCELSQTRPQTVSECFYQYQIVAPNWNRTDGSHFSLDGYFVVKLDPPPPYLTALRTRYAIPEGYVAFGLLPERMRSDVDDSIEEELKRTLQFGSVVATSVEITFAATEPRSFHLRILSTKPVP